MGRERDAQKPQQQQQQQQQQVSFTVEQLVAVNPYNPDILPDLENYVNEQVSLYISFNGGLIIDRDWFIPFQFDKILIWVC